MRMQSLCAASLSLLLVVTLSLGPVSGQSPFAVASHLVGLQWTGSSFIASYRDDVTRLLNVSLDGTRVAPFAPSFSGQAEVYVALSPAKAGFPPGYLYLCSGGSIYSVDPGGKNSMLFASVTSSVIEYITFDYTGQWGYDLIALAGDGGVLAVNSSGAMTRIFSLGSNLMPEGLTVAPSTFGAYGGDLIVSMENNHEVIAISKAVPGQNKTLAVFPGEAPERVLTIPTGQDLYIAKYDQGAIQRFDSGNFSGYAGSVLVITEGENRQTGSLNVLTADGAHISVRQVFADPNSPHFEGAAFAPKAVSGSATVGSAPAGLSFNLGIALAVLIIAGAASAGALVARRTKKAPANAGSASRSQLAGKPR
ncbi:MAG: hypothetical protein LYZ70_03080 [Nitrososphaerales archaeon]|nr:hypothetical protein [Nitrososphaerales archaeon]